MPRMVGKRVLSSVYLDPPEYAALQKLSEESRIPMAVYLREAVADVLSKYKVRVRAASSAAKHK
jgi:hypothetical protein